MHQPSRVHPRIIRIEHHPTKREHPAHLVPEPVLPQLEEEPVSSLLVDTRFIGKFGPIHY